MIHFHHRLPRLSQISIRYFHRRDSSCLNDLVFHFSLIDSLLFSSLSPFTFLPTLFFSFSRVPSSPRSPLDPLKGRPGPQSHLLNLSPVSEFMIHFHHRLPRLSQISIRYFHRRDSSCLNDLVFHFSLIDSLLFSSLSPFTFLPTLFFSFFRVPSSPRSPLDPLKGRPGPPSYLLNLSPVSEFMIHFHHRLPRLSQISIRYFHRRDSSCLNDLVFHFSLIDSLLFSSLSPFTFLPTLFFLFPVYLPPLAHPLIP